MTGNNSGALIFTLFALMDDRRRQRQRFVYRWPRTRAVGLTIGGRPEPARVIGPERRDCHHHILRIALGRLFNCALEARKRLYGGHVPDHPAVYLARGPEAQPRDIKFEMRSAAHLIDLFLTPSAKGNFD
jgi:hypothetical protein